MLIIIIVLFVCLIKEEESVNKLISSLKISNKALLKFFNQIGAVLNMYIDRKIVG